MIQWDMQLLELHQSSAWIGAVLCAFFGIFLLMLWVPGARKDDPVATSRIRIGYGLLASSVAFLFFGLYLMAGLIIYVLFFAVGVLIDGLKIAFGKN